MVLPASRLSEKSSAYFTSKLRCSPALAPRRFPVNSGIVSSPPISTITSSTSTGLASASPSCRLPLAQVVEGALDLFLVDLRRHLLNMDVVVRCDLEFRQHFERGLERQRLALMQVKIGHARLRHRLQVLLLCLLAEIARHQGFNNVALDLIGKALADDGSRDLALAKARNARLLLIAEQDGVSLCADYVSRDRNRYFAFAGIRLLLGLDVCRVGRACRAGFSRQENAFRSGCGRAQKYNRR